MRVMFVDHSRANRVVIGKCLSDLGFQTVTAADAFEASGYVKGGPKFDLLLVDMKLRGTNGLALIRQLRATPEYQSTPMILLCSAAEMDAIDTADPSGASDYLVKPFAKEILTARLELLGISLEKSGG